MPTRHTDCRGHIAVVHNGIIENYLLLRERLQAEGHQFSSETDTEVLAHLIESHFTGNLDFVGAVRAALREVIGSYALVAVSHDAPETLVAARLHSPLIIGHGHGEQFIASDVPAILAYTREVTYLQNGELAEVSRERVRITRLDGQEVKHQVAAIAWDAAAAEKGGYKHFMLKEIHEQPIALAETLRGRLNDDRSGTSARGLAPGCRRAAAHREGPGDRLRDGLSCRPDREVCHRAAGARAGRYRRGLRTALSRPDHR